MIYRDVGLLIACCLLVFTVNGCATNTKTISTVSRTIDSDSIQVIADNPTGHTLPLYAGETVNIFTKEQVSINGAYQYIVKMLVTDVDTSRIKGNLLVYDDDLDEDLVGNIVEVKFEDIELVSVWTQKASDTTKASYSFISKNAIFIEGGARMGSEKVRISEQNCVDIFFQATDCPRGFRIGEGGHLAIGFNYFIGDNRSKSLSMAAGFLKGGGIDESSSAKTLEIVFTQYYELYRLGVGLSYHVDPEYEEEIDAGYGDTADNIQLNFDDALGIVFKLGYLIRSPDWELGLRYTLMDYELANEDYNANSLGIFVSKSFL